MILPSDRRPGKLMDRHQQLQLALAWRKDGGRVSLQGFDLSECDLTRIDLAGANLAYADLSRG